MSLVLLPFHPQKVRPMRALRLPLPPSPPPASPLLLLPPFPAALPPPLLLLLSYFVRKACGSSAASGCSARRSMTGRMPADSSQVCLEGSSATTDASNCTQERGEGKAWQEGESAGNRRGQHWGRWRDGSGPRQAVPPAAVQLVGREPVARRGARVRRANTDRVVQEHPRTGSVRQMEDNSAGGKQCQLRRRGVRAKGSGPDRQAATQAEECEWCSLVCQPVAGTLGMLCCTARGIHTPSRTSST